MNYYNEFDPKKAAWLRELIAEGAIAKGDVDERSIVDVRPADLIGYRQCHFFAGIAVWSLALRAAGWPDDKPIWTASCPCQPFSTAGKRKGTKDHRHLWPTLFRLIAECRPQLAVGEQVCDGGGIPWIDSVHTDMVSAGYAFGAVGAGACSVGAPMRRLRLYWMAHDNGERRDGERIPDGHDRREDTQIGRGGAAQYMAESAIVGREWRWAGEAIGGPIEPERFRTAGGVGWPGGARLEGWARERVNDGEERATTERAGGESVRVERPASDGRNAWWAEPSWRSTEPRREPGPTNGFWRDCAWIPCTDGKYRPVEAWPTESAALSLADGIAADLGLVRDPGSGEELITHPLIEKGKARAMRLRGYGDAIVAPQAIAFVRSVMGVL